MFFGDALAADAAAWFATFGAHKGGANTIGYLNGSDYGNSGSLIDHLKLVTVQGLTSTSGGEVFSPDIMSAPSNDPITNYVFQGLPSNGGLPMFPTGNSLIPGIDETPTGAFFYQNSAQAGQQDGPIYLFYAGSPGLSAAGNNLPIPSVSYLAAWNSPSIGGPTNYNVLSRIDYDLTNDTVPSPTNPPGWQPPTPVPGAGFSIPPLGGNFIWIAPVVATDPVDGNTYVYMFGTGKYRASNVYLVRFPAGNLASVGQCSSPPCYLGQTPGFQIWTTSVPNGAAHWSPSNAPPSVGDIAYPASLSFTDDTTADAGQVSVRFFETAGGTGLWLMMYEPAGNPAFEQKVVARWAVSPTGPWSNALVVFDVSAATGSENQVLYCCQGQASGKSDPGNGPIWQCLGPQDRTQVQQIIECRDATTNQRSGSAGVPRYGLYAPDMLPYLTNVSRSSRVQSGITYDVVTFTVNYLLSVFSPYNSVLMAYTLQSFTPEQPDFSLGFNPSTITASAGTKVPVTVNVNRTGGFAGNVTVTPPSTLPKGVKVPGDPGSTTGNSLSFKIKVKGSAQPGNYPLVFAGKDDTGRERDATLTLVID